MSTPVNSKQLTDRLSLHGFNELLLEPQSLLEQDGHTAAEIEIVRSLKKRFKATTLATTPYPSTERALDLLAKIRTLAREYQQQRSPKNPGSVLQTLDSKVVKKITDSYVVLQAPNLEVLPQLPKGYGYKGGAARLALMQLLQQKARAIKPRDFDLIKIGRTKLEVDRELAKKLMADDYHHGAEIENITNIRTYFATRDLTINQVLLINGLLFCSFMALEDAINRVLRPTAYVIEENGFPQGRITMKMLRLRAESRAADAIFQIADLRSNPNVKPFDIALHLERALQRDISIAQWYLAECVQHGLLALESSDLRKAVQSLSKRVPGRLNQFKRLKRQKKLLSSKRPIIGLMRLAR